MQFQIVGHACMSVEAAGTRLVTDPWIQGSVYWDSWWHWPEPVFGPELFESDFIYVTHWHFDHFHAESLDRFSRRTHILIPRFPVSSLAGHLRDLGFTQVTEITHGARFELAPGFTLTSYQSQFQDDSVAVVEADGTVLVDLNDAKPLPSTWRRLRRRHPRVDFMMRSHSPAWSYPSRFTFEDASQAIRVHRRSYADAFVAAALILRERSDRHDRRGRIGVERTPAGRYRAHDHASRERVVGGARIRDRATRERSAEPRRTSRTSRSDASRGRVP